MKTKQTEKGQRAMENQENTFQRAKEISSESSAMHGMKSKVKGNTRPTGQKGNETMKKHTNNNTTSETRPTYDASKVDGPSVTVPEDIKSDKHARAYVHAYRASYHKMYLPFVADAYRWAVARGWKDGEEARLADADAEAAEMLNEAETAAA